MDIYSVYYINNHPKDGLPYVGCTKDLEGRMNNHKVSLNDFEILFQSEDIVAASLSEQTWQESILGQADGRLYHLNNSEEACERRSKSQRGSKRLKTSDALRGVPKSLEHRQHLSDARRGIPHSLEHCQALSVGQRGCSKPKVGIANREQVWITDGIISKKIHKDKLQSYLDNGWKRGRMKFKKSNKETNQCLQ